MAVLNADYFTVSEDEIPAIRSDLTLVGGTSLLIVVGVALEIMQNLDQQLKMRQYEGFAKQMNNKGRL